MNAQDDARVIHMASLHHIYVTAHGEWTTPNWIGEKAQIGLRLVAAEGAAEPEKGTTFTPMSNGDVVFDGGTQAGTNGTLTRTWKARLGPVASTDNADAVMQADLGDDMWTFLNAIKTYQASVFRWTHVKIAPILAGGTYGAPSAIYQFTNPIVGGFASTPLPPEVALAISLRAPVIGRRGRGRFYLPALTPNALASADGTVLPATATGIRDMTSTLITNLQDKPGVEDYGPLVAVLSANSNTAVRPSQVRVGNHWDVQRRRQHQVPETYVSATL